MLPVVVSSRIANDAEDTDGSRVCKQNGKKSSDIWYQGQRYDPERIRREQEGREVGYGTLGS